MSADNVVGTQTTTSTSIATAPEIATAVARRRKPGFVIPRRASTAPPQITHNAASPPIKPRRKPDALNAAAGNPVRPRNIAPDGKEEPSGEFQPAGTLPRSTAS